MRPPLKWRNFPVFEGQKLLLTDESVLAVRSLGYDNTFCSCRSESEIWGTKITENL
jgi:hypothetical protein